MPRMVLTKAFFLVQRSIFPHGHGGQRGRERSVPFSFRRGQGKAPALPPERFAPCLRSLWPGEWGRRGCEEVGCSIPEEEAGCRGRDVWSRACFLPPPFSPNPSSSLFFFFFFSWRFIARSGEAVTNSLSAAAWLLHHASAAGSSGSAGRLGEPVARPGLSCCGRQRRRRFPAPPASLKVFPPSPVRPHSGSSAAAGIGQRQAERRRRCPRSSHGPGGGTTDPVGLAASAWPLPAPSRSPPRQKVSQRLAEGG